MIGRRLILCLSLGLLAFSLADAQLQRPDSGYDQGTSLQEPDSFAIQEYQLHGEVLDQPRWLSGLGLLIATDDRRLSLINPLNRQSRSWVLPRLPKGRPQTSLWDVGGVPLSDERLALVNLRGGIIRVQSAPSNGAGTWLISPEGRLLNLGTEYLTVFNLRGDLIGRRKHGLSIDSVLNLGDRTFRVRLKDQQEGLVLSDASFVAQVKGSEASKTYALSLWPGRYRIESDQGTSRFIYEADASFGIVINDPASGWLAWSDKRWKLFMVALKPNIVAKDPEAIELSPRYKEIDRRLVELAHDHQRGNLAELLASFQTRLNDLEDVEWLSSLVVELVLSDQSGRFPGLYQDERRSDLLALYRLVLTPREHGELARWILKHPQSISETMELIEAAGVDPSGQLLSALDRVSTTWVLKTAERQRMLAIIQGILPSLPDSSQLDALQLLARMRR